MFLKSIELFGFKSFADKVGIEFTDGVAALLGPNGCGKSNIVDAIKWVLGEQATRSLRAERMEDVIFNGTDSRKALNVAEVTLTLSNDNEILPIDTAEIAVRRRLFRSGESEYYVNGAPVRLRELRELFYDTGIGKSAYSIMEQGKIDQVLSNKPDERRIIFEEAAGITKYKVKGQEALRKLEKTEENLRQVDGILGEVRRSHDNLKRQSEKTIEYRRLREEAFNVELDMSLLKLRALVESRDRRGTQLEKQQRTRDKLRSEIDAINESLEKNLDIVNSMENDLIEHQKQLYGVGLEKTNCENQIRIHSERVSELSEKVISDDARTRSINAKIGLLEGEIETLGGEVETNKSRIAEVDHNVSEFESHVAHAERSITENQASIVGNEEEIAQSEQRQLALEDELRAITDDIVRQLDEGLAASGYSAESRGTAEERLVSAFAELQKNVKAGVSAFGSPSGGVVNPDAVSQFVRELASRVAEISELLREYQARIPGFLDELLASEGIIERKRAIDASLDECRQRVKHCRGETARLRMENTELSGKIGEYRATLEELRVNRARMTTQVTAMEATIDQRTSALRDEKRSLELHNAQSKATRLRLTDTKAQIEILNGTLAELAESEMTLSATQRELEESISGRNKDLVSNERKLKEKMEKLGAAQNELEKLQITSAESNAEIRNLYENFRERFSRDLAEYEPRLLEITSKQVDLRNALVEIREKERQLGAVNLMALEEFEEVRQRFEFLTEQLRDLRRARADLERVTSEIQSESAALFTHTYEQIKRNFHIMFRRLFGGGRAELKLSEGDDVLESGIEIYAQPPGKKLENIALLSGGERSLTAVALLFATYVVRPSPFCLLDEIDASLDEANVGRFTDMLMEFGETSQFIVITHNKKTVASANTLLGITMEESGVSKVVSIRLGEREQVGVH